jgi:hypothetical protein
MGFPRCLQSHVRDWGKGKIKAEGKAEAENKTEAEAETIG